ncbi:MAG: hypothetical protein AB8I58_07875, partial [Anaerolineales bacterium]
MTAFRADAVAARTRSGLIPAASSPTLAWSSSWTLSASLAPTAAAPSAEKLFLHVFSFGRLHSRLRV